MSERTEKKPEDKKSPIYVGVDDGHYAIKVCTENGTCFSIPSRARQGRHLISVQDNSESFYTSEEGNVYTVSENLTNAEDTRFKDYPKSEINRVLVHDALRKAGLGGQSVEIATGLPVSYYYLANGMKNESLIAAKAANLRKGVTCGSQSLAAIRQNIVTTEAIAAYFDMLMDIEGNPTADYEKLTDATVGVIDIGGKTTDCAVVYPGGNQVDSERSGSNDVGVLWLNDRVESKLQSQFDLDMVPPRMIEQAINKGVIKISGEERNVYDMVRQEKERLAEEIMSGVRTKIGSGKDLDFVLFVGGGAIVMRDQLARHYPHHKFPENPEFANARGMLKIVKYVFGE